MAYYLTIKKGKQFKILDVTSADQFERCSNFKSTGMNLQEVDIFTTKFKDETDFKVYLYKNGILDVDDLVREISIRRKNKEEYIKVRYDLAYMEDIKYFDVYYLRSRIISMQNDKVFMSKLLDYYRNSHNSQSMIYLMRAIMLNKTDTIMSLGNALDEFIGKELYDVDITTGEAKLKYKSLHDMGMFLRNYDKRFMPRKNHLQVLKEVKDEICERENTRVRKRVNKTDPIEGQCSFFDE